MLLPLIALPLPYHILSLLQAIHIDCFSTLRPFSRVMIPLLKSTYWSRNDWTVFVLLFPPHRFRLTYIVTSARSKVVQLHNLLNNYPHLLLWAPPILLFVFFLWAVSSKILWNWAPPTSSCYASSHWTWSHLASCFPWRFLTRILNLGWTVAVRC